jgi:hypothetical protein
MDNKVDVPIFTLILDFSPFLIPVGLICCFSCHIFWNCDKPFVTFFRIKLKSTYSSFATCFISSVVIPLLAELS